MKSIGFPEKESEGAFVFLDIEGNKGQDYVLLISGFNKESTFSTAIMVPIMLGLLQNKDSVNA